MKVLRAIFHFYIHGSIHVAFSVVSLLLMTLHMFRIPFDVPMAIFTFFGTITGYNFVKYESHFRNKKHITPEIKAIAVMSIFTLLAAGVGFLFLERKTQLTGVAFFMLTLLYTVPFFPKKRNMRNWVGIKIYMVALCWAGITILLPLFNAAIAISSDVVLKFIQRFLLIIILILIFEIIDSKDDDPGLMTVPQKIGVQKTKWLNLFLLILFYCLEFFKSEVDYKQLLVNIILVVSTALFTLFATPDRPKYYTLFWVESIPIFWLGLVLLVSAF
ncbi:hypothetical protein E0W68_04480 [Flavobacterium salilacus subsp. salilacus]|uniref:hypothetical protein n=1 Tax=Flavobacterium TaxID=237 RepID=UPI001074FDBB|nr:MULTISPECIES: hypothetical protein [Flavobacterium]KAF2519606.1 hypothetical protein E0W68_04480 [Flavobacterium salilacus subsp. salilacus]MBE1614492.1 hypothetical protein [Flavobacterium sp. SaA2.13]